MKYIFDEKELKYNKKSTRYQTRRKQEKRETYEKMKKEYLELQNKLMNSENYLESDIEIFKKRFKTLKKYFSIVNKRKEQLLIPLRIDNKTTVYVEEDKCFNHKWINILGEERIKDIIEKYKKLLPLKPENIKYWNPF